MKRRYSRWVVLILVVVIAGALIWHFTRPKPIPVIVKAVESGTVEKTVANTRAGTVKACRRAKLSPGIGGQIAKLPINKGDTVKAGQLLLELWNEDLVAETGVTESEARAARARAKATCLKAQVSQREANRLLELQKTGAASEEKTDSAVTQAKALKAECAAANASALVSEAKISVIRANLARTRLLAPFDGIVAEINGELNEYVTPSPVGIPTPPAVDLIDTSCFYVTAPIDEVDAPAISQGMTARITLDAFAGRTFDGRVRRISDYVLDREKQARTVDVEVEFARHEDHQFLLAGYSADVEIIQDKRSNTLRIPTEAVLDDKRVFVFFPDRKVIQEQSIEKGMSNWDYTEIISGLRQGDLVVVNTSQVEGKDGATAEIAQEKP
jgi:HlyD family secretion protein